MGFLDWFVTVKAVKTPFTRENIDRVAKAQLRTKFVDGAVLESWGNSEHKVAQVIKEDLENNTMEFVRQKGDKIVVLDMPSEMTWADEEVIEAFGLNRAHYMMVRPFVLLGDYTNEAIAHMCGYKKRWAEGLVPRVKDAVKLWQSSPSPPPA